MIPPSLLTRIQAGELSDADSLSPASYHLAGRETVRDAASRAWSYLRGAWTAWREHVDAQPPGGVGTGAARERWLLVLLRELGYGHVPALPGGYVIEDREYPVSHAWQYVPIHLLGPGADLDHRNPGVSGAARAPQAMVQELLNRDDDRLWAILSNGTAAAPAARLHRPGWLGLPGVRPRSDLRRRAVPGVPADVAALPRLAAGETRRSRCVSG